MNSIELYFNLFIWITDGLFGVAGLIFIFNARVTHYIQDFIIYSAPFRIWQIGAIICSLGLIAQSFWSYEAITTGAIPTSYYWYLKDFGVLLMGISVFWYSAYIFLTLRGLRK